MPIDFSAERWDKVRKTYKQWWAGELDRPIIPVELVGRDPGRPMPDVPLLSQKTCADLTIPVQDTIDRIDYELSTRVYLGDAFPFFNLDCFGPGIMTAFLGARLDNSSGQVWFFPPNDLPITEIHFEYDPDNVWFGRIRDIYAAGMERWQGQVLMGMTDLGGNLDILSVFRPSEKLLLDLYDHPEEVKRLTWEAHELWHRFFDELNDILQPVNPGYSDWSGMYSDRPSYMLQSDFCYMISPSMFDEFVKPELEATCERLARRFYHLDGIGQLPHLDSLLAIENLGGVQWVPGDGKPDCAHWPEVYQKIHAAGKKIQVLGSFDVVDAVTEQIGTGGPIQAHVGWNMHTSAEETEIRKRLAKYGIE
jgi:5-methyltetrahydrofolate--homocysteine methyltransferase